MQTTPESPYLTVPELMQEIRCSRQSIYNGIHKGRCESSGDTGLCFIEGEHYIKPSARKVLFIRAAIDAWLKSLEKPKDPSIEDAGSSDTSIIDI